MNSTLRQILLVSPSLRRGLIAYWKLDEASGTRVDIIGGESLTDNNTVTQAVGKVGSAGQFTAANNEYLSRADSPALSAGDRDFTISAWVYLDSKGAVRGIVDKSDLGTSAGEYSLLFNNAVDRFRFLIQNGTSLVVATADAFGSPSLATWYHIMAWHDSVLNTVNIQINGGTVNSQATAAVVPSDTTRLFIVGSASDGAGSRWDGRIDEVKFWSRVLTAPERAEDYNNGLAGRALL